MQYPPWNDTEYGFLKKDLSGPKSMLDRLEKEHRIRELERQKNELMRKAPEGSDLKQELETKILDSVKTEKRDHQRKKQLEVLVAQYRQGRKKAIRTRNLGGWSEVDQAVLKIRDLFSEFEIQQFDEDFQEVFAHEMEAESMQSQIKKIVGEIEKIQDQIKKEWTDNKVKKWFVNGMVPRTWKDRKVSDQFPASRMAEFILRQFFQDWKSRAPLFNVPVTVNGVAIETMPDHYASVWMELYKKTGLNRVPKKMFYRAIRSGLEEKEELPEDGTQNRSGVFKKNKQGAK